MWQNTKNSKAYTPALIRDNTVLVFVYILYIHVCIQSVIYGGGYLYFIYM